MHNFRRALSKAKSYWPTLGMAAICSFVVAALWSANIGAFYPILEVTIRGESMHQWVDQEVEKSRQRVESTKAELASAVENRETLLDEGEEAVRVATAAVSDWEAKLLAEEAKLLGYRKAAPYIKRYVPGDPFQTIVAIVLVLMASTLVKHVLLITNEMLVGRVALDITRSIRMQIFDKALITDRANYSKYGASGFTSRISHTTNMLSRGLMSTLGAALREPLKVLTCLIGAAIISWRLLLLSLIVSPVVGVLLYLVTRKLRAASSQELKNTEGYHAVMLESLGNIRTVQAFQRENAEQLRFDDATLAMRNYGLKFILYTSLAKPIIEFLGLGMLGTTIIGGAYLVLNKQTALLGIQVCDEPLSVSAMFVFFGMLIGISDPLRKLSGVYASIYAGSVAANTLYSMLDQEDSIKDPENPRKVSSPHRHLQIRDVSFGYSPDQPLLKNVSLEIPYGATIAIVGHNGSGKSTLINLLNRFYDPAAGDIAFDGVDFREMRVSDVRRRIALVSQHTELFDNTVAFNIRYGKRDATDEEVILAAQHAHAHDFISGTLSDGYETLVGKSGSKLSGGQRQRIALARALLCNPEVLILDEATSQIDMESEQLIRESLEELRGLRTIVIITHREKLLELADTTYELVEGRLVRQPSVTRNVA